LSLSRTSAGLQIRFFKKEFGHCRNEVAEMKLQKYRIHSKPGIILRALKLENNALMR